MLERSHHDHQLSVCSLVTHFGTRCVRARARGCAHSLHDYREDLVKSLQNMLHKDISEAAVPFASPMAPQQRETDGTRPEAAERAPRDRRPPADMAPTAEVVPAKPKSRSGARKPKADGEPPAKKGRPSNDDKLAKAEAKAEAAEARARAMQERAEKAEAQLKAQEVELAVAKAKLQASYFITQAAGLGRGLPGSSSSDAETPDMRNSSTLPTPAALEKFFMM